MTWVTTTLVLERLKQSDEAAWTDFADRFRPTVQRFLVGLGLNSTEADDLAQDSLVAFAEAYRAGSYDRTKGRLSSWLFGITRRVAMGYRRQESVRRARPKDTAFWDGLSGADDLQQSWDREWHRAVFDHCLARVKKVVQPATFDAFYKIVVHEQTVPAVARELGISDNSVYVAKHRVLRRMREFEHEFEIDD